MTPRGVEIRRGGSELIAQLEPLYAALHEYQVHVAPRLAGMPARSTAESWQRRCALYDSWLAIPGSFVLVAERSEQAVGYAVVSTTGAFQSWASGDRVADVYDLAVVADERGRGIGSALMDAIEAELAAAGIAEFRLRVIVANREALSFYEKRGLTPISHILLGRVQKGPRPGAGG